MWAIQHFSNSVHGVTSQSPSSTVTKIRDGVVTNACKATWLMTLQGRNVEARYAQNYKSSLGNGLAACQLFNGHVAHTSGT